MLFEREILLELTFIIFTNVNTKHVYVLRICLENAYVKMIYIHINNMKTFIPDRKEHNLNQRDLHRHHPKTILALKSILTMTVSSMLIKGATDAGVSSATDFSGAG